MALLQAEPVISASTIIEAISDWIFKTTGRAALKELKIKVKENEIEYYMTTTEDTTAFLAITVGAGGYVSKVVLIMDGTIERHTDNVVAIGEYDIKLINRDLAGML